MMILTAHWQWGIFELIRRQINFLTEIPHPPLAKGVRRFEKVKLVLKQRNTY